jgi:hypothetical protein
MPDDNKHIIDLFNKLERLLAILCSFIGGITVYSISDLISFYYDGNALHEGKLALVATLAVASVVLWLVIYKKLTTIKEMIAGSV